MLRVLSLGGGVQSSCLFHMSGTGELPKLDAAIFSDTHWEPAAVYRHIEYLKQKGDEYGIPIYVVENGDIRADAMRSHVRDYDKAARWMSMPLFTKDPETGKRGMIRRQCTTEYKITPIGKKIRELLGLKPRQRGPKEVAVEQWIGISLDEWQRARTGDKPYIKHVHPLLDLRMTRAMCLDWLRENNIPEPPRSACIGCPFHSDAEWRAMKNDRPKEFADACEVDEAMRDQGGTQGKMYLHRTLMPLRDVDFRNDVDKGQLLLFDGEQSIGCEGGNCFT